MQLAIFGLGIVDVVGHHDRQPELLGERRLLRDEPVVVRQQVVGQLDEVAGQAGRIARRIAAREEPRVALARRPALRPDRRPGAGERSRRHGRRTARGGPRRAARAGHGVNLGTRLVPSRFARETSRHRLSIAHGVAREKDEMRPALARADAAQVLLDDRSMAGQACPRRARPCRQPLDHGHERRSGFRRHVLAAAGAPVRRHRRDPERPRRAARSRCR